MNTAKSLVVVALLSGLSQTAAMAAPTVPPKQTGRILFQGAIVEGATCQPQAQAMRTGQDPRQLATCSAARTLQRAPGEPVGAEVSARVQELTSVEGRRLRLLTLTYR